MNLIETKVFNSVRGKCTVFSFCMVDSRLHWMFETQLPFLLTDRELLRKAEKRTLDVIYVIFVHLSYFPPLSPTPYISLLLPFPLCFFLPFSLHLQPVLILTVIMII